MVIEAWPATAGEARKGAASLVSSLGWSTRGASADAGRSRDNARTVWLTIADLSAVLVTVLSARIVLDTGSAVKLTPGLSVALAGVVVLLLAVQRGSDSPAYLSSAGGHTYRQLTVAILTSVMIIDLSRELAGSQNSSLLYLLVLLSPTLLSVPAARAVVQAALGHAGRQSRVIVVGDGKVARRVEARLQRMRGVDVIGRVDDVDHADSGAPGDGSAPGSGVIGGLAELPRLCAENQVDQVLVAFSRTPGHLQLEGLRAATGTTISIVPRLYEMMPWGSKSDDLEGIPLIHIHQRRRSRTALVLKRAIDLAGATVLITLFSPLLLAIAVGIRLTSEGPVFFRQDRTGLAGRTFSIFKFRTMVVDAEKRRAELLDVNEVDGPIFKMHDDPRTFAFGRFLRKTSLDEIPQLFNVFTGAMSLVGPRPLPVAEAAQVAPSGGVARTKVKPGITGLWQISGRSALNGDDLQQLDAAYASSWSITWDLQILLKTPAAVLLRRGAY